MRPAPSAKFRPTAMALVLLAHVPLVLLFAWGWRASRDEPELQLVFLSLWPQQQPREPAPRAEPALTSPRSTRMPAAPPSRAQPETPQPPAEPASTAITAPAESTPSTTPPRAGIDWNAEGKAAAARQAAPPASTEFSARPKIDKPCEKQKSSWEWNKQPKKAGLAPLPYVVLGRCVVGLGFFACSPQKPPEANSHLLDDMRDGKTSPSSVPDHERCD